MLKSFNSGVAVAAFAGVLLVASSGNDGIWTNSPALTDARASEVGSVHISEIGLAGTRGSDLRFSGPIPPRLHTQPIPADVSGSLARLVYPANDAGNAGSQPETEIPAEALNRLG